MTEATFAVIGGSGLYQMEGLEDARPVAVETPFGAPSAEIVLGRLGQTDVAFLPRHGKGHRLTPTELPVRANIYALKTLGVERIVSVSAVGSLREEIRPLDAAIPDQIIDRTRIRPTTFFGDGIVAHVGMADPYCPDLSRWLATASDPEVPAVHRGGSLVVIEGPQFSTRAESELYRSWGASIIGMTALPEAKLAREAEICYATLALVTDYDCWHDTEADVSVEVVVENLHKNVRASQQIIGKLVSTMARDRDCPCATALRNAIITSPEEISDEAKSRLAPLIGHYVS